MDIRQVKDVALIEATLHKKFASRKVTAINNTRELFDIAPQEARAALNSIPDADLNKPAPINELNLHPDFISYLLALFRISGLVNFKELQESWTFTLFPSTSGGRYFTLNIDRHEVAYSQNSRKTASVIEHRIIVDQMVKKDKEVKKWVRAHAGKISSVPYASNWGNAVSNSFHTKFDDALGLFEITGFRRALVAYWYEALLRMQERQTRSIFVRFHNYDATSEIYRHMRETQRFRTNLD